MTMKVLISGASGLVGSALSAVLEKDGHEVHRLVRRTPDGAREVFWNQKEGSIDPKGVSGFDAVVHLAGENIASGRWTKTRMERIRRTGELRVGYMPDRAPFCYRNANGRLVGFDVDLVQRLARDLKASLRLVP